MYKWVGNQAYAAGGDTSSLLDDGQLYVAKFETDGTGAWVALTPEATGMDEAMIAIRTRQVVSSVGAATMDRPEWVAVNPVAVEGYCALTNNSRRNPGWTNAQSLRVSNIRAGNSPMETACHGPALSQLPKMMGL